MRLTRSLIIIFFLVIPFSHCVKDNDDCWQAYNPNGYIVPGLVVCDKSRSEAEAEFPQYWFYKQGEATYCWRVEIGANVYYAYNVPESMASKHEAENGAYTYTKIDCSSFCHCEWIEKHRSKITGLYAPNRIFTETLLSSDTCNKLFVGRVIIVSETADSIISREVKSLNP